MSGNNNRTAKTIGVLFIIGTVAGVLSGVSTGDILGKANLLAKVSTNENQILLGTFFLLIMAISLALVPVFLYPIAKKYNEVLALGYVVFRGALETFTYLVTAISWLLLVVLSKEYERNVSADSAGLQLIGNFISDSGEWVNSITMIIFSLGALMFYYLSYKFKLIPRWLSGWGVIAGILYLATGMFALFETPFTILLLPLAIQEMVMAVWLIVKGFNASANG
ncbi:DUF4386 domain-containing protein [Paenibacillus cymbidii]|uniref:DUF4386 domain-containing protein n=1 Tax=Paenibacillus cymbidii TaxID=1639034 RepID=UPI0010808B59|nr:DUF4386 domain-containing protein [Paenibacillus cymbidii]